MRSYPEWDDSEPDLQPVLKTPEEKKEAAEEEVLLALPPPRASHPPAFLSVLIAACFPYTLRRCRTRRRAGSRSFRTSARTVSPAPCVWQLCCGLTTDNWHGGCSICADHLCLDRRVLHHARRDLPGLQTPSTALLPPPKHPHPHRPRLSRCLSSAS